MGPSRRFVVSVPAVNTKITFPGVPRGTPTPSTCYSDEKFVRANQYVNCSHHQQAQNTSHISKESQEARLGVSDSSRHVLYTSPAAQKLQTVLTNDVAATRIRKTKKSS